MDSAMFAMQEEQKKVTAEMHQVYQEALDSFEESFDSQVSHSQTNTDTPLPLLSPTLSFLFPDLQGEPFAAKWQHLEEEKRKHQKAAQQQAEKLRQQESEVAVKYVRPRRDVKSEQELKVKER